MGGFWAPTIFAPEHGFIKLAYFKLAYYWQSKHTTVRCNPSFRFAEPHCPRGPNTVHNWEGGYPFNG